MSQENPVSPFLRGMLTRNANGKLVEPDNVIPSVAAAYTQYVIMRQDNIARVDLFAALEGAAAGNPPFDQDELDANGLGHKGNFNDFKFRSYIERSSQAYWNLLNGTDVFVKIVLNGNFPQLSRWANIMARNLSDVLKEWPDFHTNINLMGTQLTRFGMNPVFWRHEKSFMWEVVDVSKFFVPTQTQTLSNKLTNCCVESNYTIQELYQIYTRVSKEKTSNWNPDALSSFLIWKANTFLKNPSPAYTDFLQVQRMIDNHDVVAAEYFNETVRLVNLYQEEYGGGISHYIFDRDRLASSRFNITQAVALGGNNDFLWFADRQYDNFREAIQVQTASPGEWTIHGSLGVGQKTFAGTQATNMLSCSLFDMALMSATPLVRTLATGGRDTDPIKFITGAATDIGAAEFVQNTLGANINQLVLASQFLTATLDTNAVNAGDDPSQPDKSQGSLAPSQARSKDFKEFGILKNVAAHFYNQFDPVIQNMVVRLLKTAQGEPGYEYKKEWIERSVNDGVPEQFFDSTPTGFMGLPKQFRSIKASRIAGDGSTLARIMGLESLQSIAGTFDAKEMAAYKADWVEATLGPDYVSTYASSDSQKDEQDGGASLAAAENFMMQNGGTPVFSMDNEQDAHAISHMGLLENTLQQLDQQQISPIDADKLFSQAIPHEQQHIAAMQQAPVLYGQTLNRIEPVYKQVVKRAQLNRKNAEAMINAAKDKQAEDAAATQNVMSDAERKDFTAQRDANRADEKQTASIERNKETAQKRGEIMKYSAEQKAEVERLKAEATAKGRSQEQLGQETSDDLASQSAAITGHTPSNVDFEKRPLEPVPVFGKEPV